MDELFEIDHEGLWATVAGNGPTLLLLHGFMGSAQDWAQGSWATHFRTIAVDLAGHGRSANLPVERYSMEQTVSDLLALLDKLGVDRTAVIGYSMGGRVALQLAAAALERVAAVVLESASPGLEDTSARAERVAADELLAQRIERDGVAAFLDYWERLSLFAGPKNIPPDVQADSYKRRLQNSATGLAASLRGMGTGEQKSLWGRLAELNMPILLIAGENDAKFSAIARQMASALSAAKLIIVPDAGHRVQLDQPIRYNQAVLPFLVAQTKWVRKGE